MMTTPTTTKTMTTNDTDAPKHPTAADLTALATRRTADREAVDALALLLGTMAEIAAEARRFHTEADKGFLPAPHLISDNDDARREAARKLRDLADLLEGPKRNDERNPKFEGELAAYVRAADGLTWGYIGNLERWGDDRRLCIWVDGVREANGNQKEIWTCEARDFTRGDMLAGKHAVNRFLTGYRAGKAAAKA